MTKNYSFLPLLLDEEVFLLKEVALSQPVYEEPANVEDAVPDLVFQGKNRKSVVILVDQPETEFVEPGQDLLLRNILTALNLDFNDVALVNLAHCRPKPGTEHLKKIGCQKLIGFGIGREGVTGLNIPGMNLLAAQSDIQYLFTHSLDELNQDKNKKMALWKNLKPMFNLK